MCSYTGRLNLSQNCLLDVIDLRLFFCEHLNLKSWNFQISQILLLKVLFNYLNVSLNNNMRGFQNHNFTWKLIRQHLKLNVNSNLYIQQTFFFEINLCLKENSDVKTD